jgi:hypothetical protein
MACERLAILPSPRILRQAATVQKHIKHYFYRFLSLWKKVPVSHPIAAVSY